jgi:hypothetical protein
MKYIWLIGDGLILLFFAWYGRIIHHLPITAKEVLFTAFPFLVCWYIISPWFGIFSQQKMKSLRQTFWRISIAVITAISAGVWLRYALIQTPFNWLFYWVTLGAFLPLFWLWRVMGYFLAKRL